MTKERPQFFEDGFTWTWRPKNYHGVASMMLDLDMMIAAKLGGDDAPMRALAEHLWDVEVCRRALSVQHFGDENTMIFKLPDKAGA